MFVKMSNDDMDVEGRRRKGRPKRRWMDNVNVYFGEKGLPGETTQNMVVWMKLVGNVYPIIETGETMRWKMNKACDTI